MTKTFTYKEEEYTVTTCNAIPPRYHGDETHRTYALYISLPVESWFDAPEHAVVFNDWGEFPENDKEFAELFKDPSIWDDSKETLWTVHEIETYGDAFLRDGGNLGWCVPYWSNNGKVAIVENETDILSIAVDGEEVSLTDGITPEIIKKLAEAVGATQDLEEYEYTDPMDAIREHCYEAGCRDCPHFDDCEAMNEILEI